MIALSWRLMRSSQNHYENRPWEVPLDFSRIHEHQRAKAARAADLTLRQYQREVARALGGLAALNSLPIYVTLIMVPVSAIASTSSVRAHWLLWLAVAFVAACSVTLVRTRAWWAQPRTKSLPPA